MGRRPHHLLRNGAVGLSGDERPATAALRRDAALLRRLGAPASRISIAVTMPKPAAGKLPEGVTAVELVSPAASAVSITNAAPKPFHDELRVLEPLTKRDAGRSRRQRAAAANRCGCRSSVSLGPEGLCRECTNFRAAEHIVYATAELLSIEFENGILAMEFAAPRTGEVILQLAREPVGPYLAAGKPTEFDWDENAHARAPHGSGEPQPGNRVRIGIAMEAPDTSAFFNDARRLMIGQKNMVSTAYSSAEVAARSRLRLPEGFTAARRRNRPTKSITRSRVPADALHGDFANLALEADGVPLGRAPAANVPAGLRPSRLRHADAFRRRRPR